MSPTKKVFANYVSWFKTPAELGGRGEWLHWDNNRDKSKPHNPDVVNLNTMLRDIASVHYPAIGPYDSADPDLIEYHIMLAILAGIDGFVIEWVKPNDHRAIDQATLAMRDKIVQLRESYNVDFKILFGWEDSYLGEDIDEGASTLKYAWDNYIKDKSLYVWDEDNNSPILLVFPYFKGERKSFGPKKLKKVLEIIDYSPTFSYPFPQIKEKPALIELDEVKSIYCWIAAPPWNGKNWGEKTIDEFFSYLNKKNKYLEFGIAGVYPGFDDIGVGAGWIHNPKDEHAHRFLPRNSDWGNTYESTWKKFSEYTDKPKADVPWVQIITWNDWNEGHEIEPSTNKRGKENFDYGFGFGHNYLISTMKRISKYKNTEEKPNDVIYIPEKIYKLRKAIKEKKIPQKTESIIEEICKALYEGAYEEAIAASKSLPATN